MKSCLLCWRLRRFASLSPSCCLFVVSLVVRGLMSTVRGSISIVRGFLADFVSHADSSQHTRHSRRENLARYVYALA